MVDLHTHILPNVDDGVRSLAEAIELAAQAGKEGTTAIAATPHVRGDYPTSADVMEQAVRELRRELAAARIAVDLLPGAEVEIARLWEIPRSELLRLTIGQTGRYLLVEMPYRGWPQALAPAIHHFGKDGITLLLAHPERNPEVQDQPALVQGLVREGALVQVTAASIDGRLGSASRQAARKLLELGLVHVIASDAHAPDVRGIGLTQAAEALGDAALGEYLTSTAPAAIAAGDPIPSLPSLRANR